MPGGSGPQFSISDYKISITPEPLSQDISNLIHSSPWNVSLEYNVQYLISIISLNCIGGSDSLNISMVFGESIDFSCIINSFHGDIVVDCGIPKSPPNGTVMNYTTTRISGNAIFTCDSGFLPNYEVLSVCTDEGLWHPPPEYHVCALEGKFCCCIL